MTNINLTELAKQCMLERKLLPEYPIAVVKEVEQIPAPAKPDSSHIRDMKNLLWFSLDNDESRDLDQLTFAEKIDDDTFKIYIAVADVDC